jgi:hypothetical protein
MAHLIKIITHPLVIILLFCGIIISGEETGGFYIFYILLGLPHFVLHSVLGILGIISLLFTHYNKKIKLSFLRVLGACFMISSLLYFFLQPNGSYNYDTFHQMLPLSILIVFGILIAVFIFFNTYTLLNNKEDKGLGA